MTYNIKLTNGQTLVNIPDGEADYTHSSITLFGKNFSGYGPILDQNQVQLLENFSFVTPPSNPIEGQLWWNSADKRLNVRTGSDWKIISGPTASSSAPVTTVIGDQWWDTANKQLNTFDGVNWKLIGPVYTTTQGRSGPVVQTVLDSNNIAHTVVVNYVNNQVVSVLSNDPTFDLTSLTGFTSLKPGVNLPTSNKMYYGDSENALSLGGVLAGNYLRSDVASTTNFPLSVKTNSGLNVGLNNDFTIAVQGSEVSLTNNILGRDTTLYTNIGGTLSPALRVDAVTGLVSIFLNPILPTNIANRGYVDGAIQTTAATLLRADGATAIIGTLLPATANTYSLGSSTNSFDSVFSRSVIGSSISGTAGNFTALTVTNAPTVGSHATPKSYVDNAITSLSGQTTVAINASATSLIGGAPANMQTLGALASALGNNPTFAADLASLGSGYAPLNSPNFVGTPLAPTPALTINTNQIATTAYVSGRLSTQVFAGLTSNSPTFTGVVNADVISTTGGIITPTNGTIDIGSVGNRFQYVYGTAVKAKYADLAEMYVSDADYEPGTVLEFGGDFEVTKSSTMASTKVAGVVSTAPAYLMNDECSGEFTVAVALQGRCKVNVCGRINKGDRLVSFTSGLAYSPSGIVEAGTIIGKALENFNGDFGTIEVAVGRC